MKKIFFAICFALLFSCMTFALPSSVASVDKAAEEQSFDASTDVSELSADIVDSGFFEDDYGRTSWTLDSEGNLVISGYGEMVFDTLVDYDRPAPWGRDMKTVTIQEGVTTIEAFAFFLCENLEEVSIPDSVKEISTYAFAGAKCFEDETNWKDGLIYVDDWLVGTTADLGECEVIKTCRGIGYGVFSDNDSLTSIDIPKNVKYIGRRAFEQCKNLKEVKLSNGLIEIGSKAFEGCESLESITIPHTVTEIYSYAFAGCKNLKEVKLYDGLLWDLDHTNLLTMSRCDGIFYGCESLKSVVLPDTLVNIPFDTFVNCKSLESVTIHGGAKWVASVQFYGCENLKDVNFIGTQEEWKNVILPEGAGLHFYTEGDITVYDRTIDIDDAVSLFLYSMMPDMYPVNYPGSLDFNNDGSVDIDDAVVLFQHSMMPELYPLV